MPYNPDCKDWGTLNLEVPHCKKVDMIAADPQPDWSFDALLLELNSLEKKLKSPLNVLSSITKPPARGASKLQDRSRVSGAFAMRIESDDEEEKDHDRGRVMISGRRFSFDELSFSDSEDSDDELELQTQSNLMVKGGFVEGALSQLTHEQQLNVMEEVRSHVLELESNLVSENEKFASIIGRVDKYRETKREMDRRFDMQYQRSIAEALDNHLTAVQRDHEHKSQIEERRIRDDAVREEAQRREKAVQEEKVRQQKLRAEAEIQARLEAERAAKAEAEKAVALEAERKAAEEAAKKKTSSAPPQGSASQVTDSKQSAGNMTRGAENALKLEVERLRAYTELAAQNNAMRLRSNMDYRKHEQKIARNIRQITGTQEIVRAKANELIKLISDPSCPHSISIASFADKFVSLCENSTGSFNRFVYSYGHVIVLVTSKVPIAMDILIAQLNRVCIYTVPKHIIYSRAAYESTEAYYKAIGYREEDGKIESTDSFLERLGSYMKLYGALVQTEVEQNQNLHGIAQGWAWLARFLNTLPANIYTVVALQSFLEMAGFTLYRRYGTQFKKLLRIIDRNFLTALKAQDDPKLNKPIVNIRNYLDSNQFLKEPEGWKLETNIESHSTNLW